MNEEKKMLQRRMFYCESNFLHLVNGKTNIEKIEYRNYLVVHQEIQNSVVWLEASVLGGILFLTRLLIETSNQIVQCGNDEPGRSYKRGMKKSYV